MEHPFRQPFFPRGKVVMSGLTFLSRRERERREKERERERRERGERERGERERREEGGLFQQQSLTCCRGRTHAPKVCTFAAKKLPDTLWKKAGGRPFVVVVAVQRERERGKEGS